jgi:sugar/nucleoside kinase (ribokinase family)
VLDDATALLVDGHHLAAGFALASAARARGIRVLADGGSWKPGLAALLALVDVAVLSADFVVPGAGDPLAAVARLGPTFVARSAGGGHVRVRLGSGAYDELAPPAVPAGEVVDTLGAGDVLHGATGAALARGLDPWDALREGIAVASESVRHAGALGWVHARR